MGSIEELQNKLAIIEFMRSIVTDEAPLKKSLKAGTPEVYDSVVGDLRKFLNGRIQELLNGPEEPKDAEPTSERLTDDEVLVLKALVRAKMKDPKIGKILNTDPAAPKPAVHELLGQEFTLTIPEVVEGFPSYMTPEIGMKYKVVKMVPRKEGTFLCQLAQHPEITFMIHRDYIA